jgi:phosphoglycolate phosphatase-like HAD superfamily hydrolase
LTGGDAPQKEPHLRRHLAELGVHPSRVLLVGDTVDDMQAARACGTASVLYHPFDRALLSRNRAEKLGTPVVGTLYEAVAWVIAANGGPGPGC